MSLSSASTCGSAQNGSLIRCAFDREQVGVADRDRIQSLMVHTKPLLDIWDVCSALAPGLVDQYILTADTVDYGLGMAVREVLDADDQAFAAGCHSPA